MRRPKIRLARFGRRFVREVIKVGALANRGLRLGVAEIASRERLRALAPKFNLGPPAPGQVVTLP